MRVNGRLLMMALTVSACALPPNDLSRVSGELLQRTGNTLNAAPVGDDRLLPPTVCVDDGLAEDEAVAVALWNNAAFEETLADLGIARADLIQAGMIPNPTYSVLIPVNGKPLEMTARLPLEILWLRPKRVAAAELDYDRTAQRLVQSGLDLIRDVRLAYTELALAQQRVVVAQGSEDLLDQIARITQARLAAGDISELETSVARVDALQAQEQRVRFEHDADVANERLRHLMGIGSESPFTLATASPPQIELEIGPLLSQALTERPDLLAAKLALDAAGERIGLSRVEVFAFATGVNAKDVGDQFLAGPLLDLALPIFNQNQGGIAQAKARFEKAARQYYTVHDRITLEVRESHTRALQAQESIGAWEQQILPPLEESVRRSQKAYAAGDIPFLLVLDTTRRIIDARFKGIAAEADFRRAVADLERSIGGRIPVAGEHVRVPRTSDPAPQNIHDKQPSEPLVDASH